MRALLAAAAAAGLCGCGPEERRWTEAPEVALFLPAGPFVDPGLEGGGLAVEVEVGALTGGGCALALRVDGARGEFREHVVDLDEPGAITWEWDARDDAGAPFGPGVARMGAVVECGDGGRASAEAEAVLLRLGIESIDLYALDGEQVPLAYHKVDLARRGIAELPDVEYLVVADDGGTALDTPDGEARGAVEPWTEPDFPPWGAGDPDSVSRNLPAAFVAGSTVGATVGLAAEAVFRGRAVPAVPDGVSVRIRPAGGEPGAATGAGGAADVVLGALPEVLGRDTLEVEWRAEARVGDGEWAEVPGWLATRHLLYRTAGPAALRDGTEVGAAPAIAWVGVLDDLADALDGVEPDPAAVLDALRDRVNGDPYLVYDPSDAAYSHYDGAYVTWDYIVSELSDWLDRSQGLELYCHSTSCLLSTLAGHVGVRAEQLVLGVGFTTNYLRAAGTDDWARWGFNSHSVVSPDGETVWDASLDLDGDADPASLPAVPLPPRGLALDDYLARLTPDEIGVVNEGLCYFE